MLAIKAHTFCFLKTKTPRFIGDKNAQRYRVYVLTKKVFNYTAPISQKQASDELQISHKFLI